jgi:cellulose synthase/poly-beta-1,6-N-acetylglucosamine synthase-like glycosyltransferase
VYAAYPLAAFAIARMWPRPVRTSAIEPTVSVVIAAYNESANIATTVRNKLEQDYPADRLEVIVVSDGSNDGTDAAVLRVASDVRGRVRLLHQPRRGKTVALNRALAAARGEIVVVSDANSIYARDAVRMLVRNFADPEVGYVTGRMVYTNPAGSGIGEGSVRYMSYETFVREQETRIGSIVGVDGGVDALRRELYSPMRAEELPDFALPLDVVRQGRRVVHERDALVFEPALGRARDEFRMRVRVSLRAMWTLWEKRELLALRRYGLFAWQLFSHKVLRYAAFVPLTALLASSAALAPSGRLYLAALVAQVVAYGTTALGHALRNAPAAASLLRLPYYFVLLNVACAVAAWHFLRGRRIAMWTPRIGK